MSQREIASCTTAPQYAEYRVVFNPKNIPTMSTIDLRKVLRMGFAVGQSRTFIYPPKYFFLG
jgi:hypothetical protein